MKMQLKCEFNFKLHLYFRDHDFYNDNGDIKKE